jgi:diacylglycerol kinase (ATP)
MKLLFVINPRSGRRRRTSAVPGLLREFVTGRRLEAEFATTEGPGHATEIAREAVASGFSRIVAVGGDGTVNEVAQALIHAPAAMGLVPCGSGNGLALHLGLPTSLSSALDLATGTSGRIAELDTGAANGFPFVNVMGTGLDADVSRRFNRLARRGLAAYTRTALAAFLGRRTQRCRITAAGRSETLDTILISVANSDQYGNNARIAPGARVDDGVLDLVAVCPTGLLGAAALGARLFLGSIDRGRGVRRLSAARFLIERPAAGIIHTDGETHETGASVEVVALPRSLRFVVPAGCTAVGPGWIRAETGFALHLP